MEKRREERVAKAKARGDKPAKQAPGTASSSADHQSQSASASQPATTQPTDSSSRASAAPYDPEESGPFVYNGVNWWWHQLYGWYDEGTRKHWWDRFHEHRGREFEEDDPITKWIWYFIQRFFEMVIWVAGLCRRQRIESI